MQLKRNANLDLLKLLSCMAVVGLHVFTYSYENIWINYLHYMSGYAVPVFFMVNGYLILNKKEVSYSYVFQKILHIMLIVTLWNLLIFLAYLILKRELLNPFLMILQSLIQKGYMWQFWFLGAMILTYLAAPFLHKLLHRLKNGFLTVSMVLYAICLGFWIIGLVRGNNLTDNWIQTFHIWKWLFYFVMGGYLKSLIPWLNAHIPYLVHVTVFILLFIGFPLYQSTIGRQINYGSYYTDPLALCSNLGIFTFVMRIPCDKKASSAIVGLSSLGMGCYIIHPALLNVVNQYIDYQQHWIPFVLYPVILMISFLITFVMKKFRITKYFVDL